MSSTTPVVNFEVTRGDDVTFDVTFDQLVAGFSAMRFTMREAWATTETDNTAATYTLLLTATGDYTASGDLPNATTQTWLNEIYVYDVQVITSVGSKKFTTQRGVVRLTPDATR